MPGTSDDQAKKKLSLVAQLQATTSVTELNRIALNNSLNIVESADAATLKAAYIGQLAAETAAIVGSQAAQPGFTLAEPLTGIRVGNLGRVTAINPQELARTTADDYGMSVDAIDGQTAAFEYDMGLSDGRFG